MKKYRLRLIIYVFLMFGILGILTVSCFGYWKQILANRKLKKELETKYSELLSNEEKLEGEVIKLQDPDYIAKYAREKYYYSKEGELIIKIPSNS